MNIAYIVPSLAAKGPVIVVKELSELMLQHGHRCTIYYFDDKRELTFSAPTYLIKKNSIIDFTQFDIVHSHGLRPDKYVACNREYSGKVRYVTTLHNYIFSDLNYQYNYLIAQFFGRLWLCYLRKFDMIVTLSKDATYYYKSWLPEKKLTHVYNTRIIEQEEKLSVNELKEISDFKSGGILIGVNALLTARKGIDMVICALVRLTNYKLFIVGDGKVKADLIALAKKKGVLDRCYFAGYKKDAHRFIPYYDVYAMPSRSEGFGLSLLEAAIYKCSVVCSDIPIFREIFSSAEVAYFELENIESLAQAIVNVTYNEEMRSNIYKKYITEYSSIIFYEKYIAVYESNKK